MITTLSVLLPVYNAQQRLYSDVTSVLDVLPELSPEFELLIIDDGSTDDTVEIARELATCYPQVDYIRHPLRLGLDEAIETGLMYTEGQVVFVGDMHFGLDPNDLRKLWRLRTAEGAAPARQPTFAPLSRSAWSESFVVRRALRRPSRLPQQARQTAIRKALQWIDVEPQPAAATTRRTDMPRAKTPVSPKNCTQPGRLRTDR